MRRGEERRESIAKYYMRSNSEVIKGKDSHIYCFISLHSCNCKDGVLVGSVKLSKQVLFNRAGGLGIGGISSS